MKKISFIAIIMLFASLISKAQNADPKVAEVKIKTSAICGQCKKRIEHDLAFEKGVVSSNLDVDSKIVTVTYKTQKTNPDKIKTAISKIGYAADDVKADEKAWSKLPECCQKETEGEAH